MDTFSFGNAFAATEVAQWHTWYQMAKSPDICLPTRTHEHSFLKGDTLHSDLQNTVRTLP